MDLFGRPAQRISSPAVAFLNEHPKSLSFSLGFTPPRSRNEDDAPDIILSDRSSFNQQQQNQQQPPPLHQRPASTRFLNRPQSSSGVRRSGSFGATREAKQRPRTARDGARILPTTTQTFVKRSSCITQDTETTKGPEIDDHDIEEELTDSSPTLDEQYLQQLKADILHIHNVHRQREKEASEIENNGDRLSRSTTTSMTQAPNHVKNLLLHRDTKAYQGWSSQRSIDLEQNPDTSSIDSIQTQLLRYNYSSNPAQLAAAKIGLEGLLADTLISLMEFCLAHDASDGLGSGPDSTANAFKMKLVRPATQQHGDTSLLPFANGRGTNPVSIYAGGMLSVLQQTEVLKRTMLACTGEKKVLVKIIADKDTQLNQLSEQIDFFKDTLARRRPRFESSKRIHVHYEQREQDNACDPVENEKADSLVSILAEEQLARLATLEKDRVESILSIQNLEGQRIELEQKLEKANTELLDTLRRLEIAEQKHQESMTAANTSFQEQVKAMEKRLADLQSSLASTVERHRTLESSTAQEKTQLRRDKQELERLIRLKEDETGKRQAQATAKAEAEAQSATTQLKIVTQQLNHIQQAFDGLQRELKAALTDNKQLQGTIHNLQHDVKVRNEDVERLTSKLAVANTTADSKNTLLQTTEARVEACSKEIERQQVLLEEQAQQMQMLEAKLSRSVPVDDEELQSRQQGEESTWHQRVSALEHALVAERQNTALFQELQRKTVAMEQEKAAHAVEQAQAVAAELATANLCLLERKRQREQEQKAFEDRVAELVSDKAALESEFNALRSQHEQLQQMTKQSAEEDAATENKLREEIAAMKEELKNLTEIRENLDRALAHALASPRGKSVRHQTSLSELRAELHKAKQKIAGLEEQLSRNGGIRTSEIDGKLAQLSARERRSAEEQRELKKQRATAHAERVKIEKERAELDQQRESQEAVASQQKTDHELLQQIIMLLAQRLQVMMALFDTEPSTATPVKPASDDVESWREMQQKWEALRQQLEGVDWKLKDMRSQLEALYREYIGASLSPLDGKQSSRSSLLSGFHGPNPFSDAVAAGRDTVPVAEQLKASRLLRRLSCPDESLESRARQVKVEEHETFALALARDMATMKEGYERQLEKLRGELCKTQQLRQLTSQRLRAELVNERSRSQRTEAQLSERIAELEAALESQEKALVTTLTQQQVILDQHAEATSDDERLRALHDLAELVGSEQRRRERERLSKLLTYCGASSVTVERRDHALEEETVDAVLARLHVED